MAIARRNAMRSGAYPPTSFFLPSISVCMLKVVYVTHAISSGVVVMPFFFRLGASSPPGSAICAKSSGTGRMTSCSPLRKASQRGWSSSITYTSTRPTMGRRLPFRRAAISRERGSSPDSPSKNSSRKSGFASSTIFEPRVQLFNRKGPVPTGCEWKSSP